MHACVREYIPWLYFRNLLVKREVLQLELFLEGPTERAREADFHAVRIPFNLVEAEPLLHVLRLSFVLGGFVLSVRGRAKVKK